MPESSKEYEHRALILCEGAEDCSFFTAFLSSRMLGIAHVRHTGPTRFDRGGHSRFGEALRAAKVSRSFRVIDRVLLVVDSDDDPQAAFQSVRQQLLDNGFAAPNNIAEVGNGSPVICIITMPLGSVGNLETVLLEAALATDRTNSASVQKFVSEVATPIEWTEPRKHKLTLRASISSRWPRDPDLNLVPLFRDPRSRRLIPLEHQSLNPLAKFISEFLA